jgi:hypothetical protein
VERLREHFLARARLAFDDDRDVARGDARKERIQATHLAARAEDVSEASCVRGCRGRCLGRPLDRERGLTELDRFAASEIRIADAKPVHTGAVGRAQVHEAQRAAHDLERQMTPRGTQIRESQRACRARSDEDCRRRGVVDDDVRACVRTDGDTDGVGRVAGRCRVVAPPEERRRVVVDRHEEPGRRTAVIRATVTITRSPEPMLNDEVTRTRSIVYHHEGLRRAPLRGKATE